MKNSPTTLAKRNDLRAHFKATIDPATVPPYKERQCVGCGELKPCRWMTTFTQTGTPEYRNRCDECWNARGRERAKTNRETLTSQRLDRQYARKVKCVEYKGGKCQRCGYQKCVKAMNFHHVDPSTKEFEISQRLDTAWEKLTAELDKCVLLCFNCHMEEHCERDHSARESLKTRRQWSCAHTLEKEWE